MEISEKLTERDLLNRWKGRVGLVTGASSGIGAAVTKMLASHLGMVVIGCAPSIGQVERIQIAAEKLELKTVGGSIHAIKCDLSKEEDILTMFAEIKDSYGGIDVCINNAGLAHPATLLEGKTHDWWHMIDINVLGPCICSREAIKSMKERKVDDGHIINICSLSGHRVQNGISDIHMYSATKYAIKAITEGLRQELREMKSHIRVGQISPGDVNTEFVLNMYPNDHSKHGNFVGSGECLDPEDVANAILFVLTSDTHVQVHDILLRSVVQDS